MDENFKIRALESDENYFNKGDVIEFKDGQAMWIDGRVSLKYKNFEDFIAQNYEWEKDIELIKEEGENKMEDLRELIKPCYVVKLRNGDLAICLERVNNVIGMNDINDISIGFTNIELLDDQLRDTYKNSNYDIMEIYGYPNGADQKIVKDRPLIWKRTEISPIQLKLEELEKKQREIADEMEKLRKEL